VPTGARTVIQYRVLWRKTGGLLQRLRLVHLMGKGRKNSDNVGGGVGLGEKKQRRLANHKQEEKIYSNFPREWGGNLGETSRKLFYWGGKRVNKIFRVKKKL